MQSDFTQKQYICWYPVSNILLAHYIINKLTPHGMSKNQKNSTKLMLTQWTFDPCIFQFRSWFPTDSLVDKWHNLYMDIWRCTNTFVRLEYRQYLVHIFQIHIEFQVFIAIVSIYLTQWRSIRYYCSSN